MANIKNNSSQLIITPVQTQICSEQTSPVARDELIFLNQSSCVYEDTRGAYIQSVHQNTRREGNCDCLLFHEHIKYNF